MQYNLRISAHVSFDIGFKSNSIGVRKLTMCGFVHQSPSKNGQCQAIAVENAGIC